MLELLHEYNMVEEANALISGNLTRLEFDYKLKIGYRGAKIVGAFLAENDTVTDLRVSMSELSPDGGVAIAEALEFNNSLFLKTGYFKQ